MPGMTRIARRIYVGNLSVSAKYDKATLMNFFTNLCKSHIVNITTPKPIKNVWLSAEKHFCFVEFRSVRDAETAVETFVGMVAPCGRELRVGRPKNYNDAPPPEFYKILFWVP
eukprot:UN32670